ncbi:TIGR04255 family protein [Mesorhizobium sp. M0848]|uniref:TIGR04255 family protein n=1 Tax=Mesorhizobium sp. M0848 TaxID=2957012 RepID=UPI00333B7162
MSFEPISGKHAIVEAVFGVTLRRAFNSSEIEALVNSHDRWRGQVPKLSRQTMMQVAVGEGIPPAFMQAPAGGVIFDRVKPDGTLAWRLSALDQSLLVNCGDYTRWAEVFPTTLALMTDAAEVAAISSNPITNLLLQYVDIFEWKDRNKSPRFDQILDLKSDWLPKNIGQSGHLWHVHQGWFRTEGLPMPGRLLERINFDGVMNQNNEPALRIDSYLRLDLQNPIKSSDLFRKSQGREFFEFLHNSSKELISKFLTKAAQDRIALNASN